MKRWFCFGVCCLFFALNASAFSSRINENTMPLLKVDSGNLFYDLGEVGKDCVVTKTIYIKNKLEHPFTIQDVRSTCECVGVQFESQTLKRNGTAALEITIDTAGYENETEAVIYILTDDVKYEVIALRLFLRVIEDDN